MDVMDEQATSTYSDYCPSLIWILCCTDTWW